MYRTLLAGAAARASSINRRARNVLPVPVGAESPRVVGMVEEPSLEGVGLALPQLGREAHATKRVEQRPRSKQPVERRERRVITSANAATSVTDMSKPR